MTTVFDSLNFRPGAGLPLTQDAAHFQRSVLSQLERQWLDDWAVADQLNAGAAAAAVKPPAEISTPPAEAGKNARQGVAPMPASTPTALQLNVPAVHASPPAPAALAGQDRSPRQSESVPPQRTAEKLEVNEAGFSRQASAEPAMNPAAAAVPNAQASSTEIQDSPARHPPAKAEVTTSGTMPSITSPSKVPALVRDHDVRGVNGLPGPVAPAGASAEALVAKQLLTKGPASAQSASTVLEPLSRPSSALSSQSLSMGINAASIAPGAANEDSTDPELSAPARGSKATPDRPEEAEPNPRFLRLREVNSQEAVASLRDAELERPASQRAAQGLARALMEAGYSRVQVVVNGVLESQGKRELNADGSETTSGTAAHQAANRSNPSSTETQHGN